jgi:dynein heavy chain
MFLKAVKLPDFRPPEPDANDKSQLPDQTTWLFDDYDRLRNIVTKIIDPLDEYMKMYDQYEKEYQFNPSKEMEQYDDPENWPEVDALKAQILNHVVEEKRLESEIPEEIVVSVFKISTKVIRENLADKHRQIANDMIELIAKIAKQNSNKLLAEFEEFNERVEAAPKNIEELSSTKDFMDSLPNELDKQKQNIKNCMKIYETLDLFHYKFEDEEEQDKVWLVKGAPKETMERIEKQKGLLEKEKERFIKQMDNNKTDFSMRIMDLEAKTASFKDYQNAEDFEKVAQLAKDYKQGIDDELAYAKMINNQENLVGQEEITDYSSINQMIKEFKPYYDLWTTVETWRNSYTSWLNDPFEDLDAKQVEDTVDAANKTMSQVNRFFRDKDLSKILEIAADIKKRVDDFKEQVPILTALRTDGMKDRHWDMLSEKVGFEVKPGEGFTFKDCMNMNLIEFSNDIVDIGEKAGKEFTIESQLSKMKADWL